MFVVRAAAREDEEPFSLYALHPSRCGFHGIVQGHDPHFNVVYAARVIEHAFVAFVGQRGGGQCGGSSQAGAAIEHF